MGEGNSEVQKFRIQIGIGTEVLNKSDLDGISDFKRIYFLLRKYEYKL